VSDRAVPGAKADAGAGEMVFRRRAAGERTVAETCAARSPLKLLTPKNHGSHAWVFAATFGGGLVDGDSIALRAHLHPGAQALLGTQASTKVYKGSGCGQSLTATVEDGASLVVLPDPVSPFAGSRFTQRNEVHLGAGASLLLVDAFSCGRVAHGERWELSRYRSTTRVYREGRLFLHDAVLLDADHGDLGERMGRFEALATVSLVGPQFRPLIERALGLGEATPTPLTRRADVLVSASPLPAGDVGGPGRDGAVVRLAAISIERLTTAIRALLRNLPEILGDDPFARKW
jgi:urease accessory protein